MGLLGAGAVAIWHDIAQEGRQEFYAWHGSEHMPERVGIPGFLRGRRYVALDADLEFFNLYETESPEVLTASAYLERLNDPTPWTRETVPHFRGVARSLCRVAASMGHGQGGLVATLRYDVDDDNAAAHAAALRDEILPEIADRRGVAGAHLLVADAEASALETAEQRVRTEKNRIPRWVVLVEGWGDSVAFQALCADALTPARMADAGAATPPVIGIYQVQATVAKTDLDPGRSPDA